MKNDNSDPNVLRESIVNPVRNVAVVGLFDSEGRILLVRTKRFPDHWQPVGGGIKSIDTNPIDTLRRELREELGISLEASCFEPQTTADYDFGKGIVYFYVALYPDDLEVKVDTSEVAEWSWFHIESTKDLNTFPATQKFLKSLRDNPPPFIKGK